MNCSSCNKPVAVGAAKCPACGAAVSSAYSYDLLPEEPEAKKDEPGQQFVLPPGAVLPPPVSMPSEPGSKPSRVLRADRPRGANALGGDGKPKVFKMLVGGGVALILVVGGMQLCSGPSVKITGAAKIEQSFMTSNIMTVARPFEIVGGKAEYEFTVEPKTGDVLIGVVKRGSKERINPEVVKGWTLTPVAKGETKTLTGELDSGTYSFVVATDSKVMVQGKLKGRVD